MNRAQMIFATDEIIEAAKTAKEKETTPVIFIPQVEDFTKEEKGEDEYESLGFFISYNPLDEFRHTLLNYTAVNDLSIVPEGRKVLMGGLITNLKEITTKAKKQMAFFELEDLTGRVEVVVFSNLYTKNKHLFKKNNIVRITGKLEIQTRDINGEEISSYKIILYGIEELKKEKKIEKIILFPNDSDDFSGIYDIVVSNPGTIPIEIEYKKAIIKLKYKLAPDKEVLNRLESSCNTRRIYGN